MFVRSLFYVLFTAVVLFLFYEDQMGHVVIQVASWRIQVSLWLMLVIQAGIYWSIRMASGLLSLPNLYNRWLGRRSSECNLTSIADILLAFTEGNEKQLTANLKRTRLDSGRWVVVWPLVQAMFHGLSGDGDEVKRILRKITHVDKQSHQRASFVHALISYIQLDYPAVISQIEPLLLQYPDHHYLITLLISSHWELAHYEWLYRHRSLIKQGRYLTVDQMEVVDYKGAEQVLSKALESDSLDDFYASYSQLARPIKQSEKIVGLYLEYLQKTKQSDQMTKYLDRLYRTTKASWVIEYYGTVLTGDEAERINTVIKYLGESPKNLDWMLCLARLYRARYQNQEALVYLEHVMADRQDSAVLKELAGVYKDTQQFEQAVACLMKVSAK
ncbi:MAG: hypothetical protein CMF46_04875 [Legionellales bacterium]|nr:hypothetical protein [Legionellales bacterium]